jgi:hypothetical protein
MTTPLGKKATLPMRILDAFIACPGVDEDVSASPATIGPPSPVTLTGTTPLTASQRDVDEYPGRSGCSARTDRPR